MVRNIVEVVGLAVARTVHLEVPESDAVHTGQPRPDLHHGGWAERIVEELLRAVPHHLHRPSRGLRQARRLHRLRRSALSAEAATHVERDDAHVRFRQMQRLRHLPLHPEGSLRAGPHRDPATFHLCQR